MQKRYFGMRLYSYSKVNFRSFGITVAGVI